MNKPSRRLTLESLEDRCVPATFGTPWPNATELTLSFAPDGTLINGQKSNLFQKLNPLGAAASWQKELLRGFQTWAAHANVNLRVVADSGDPFGTPGQIKNDARFGDIRIGAINLNSPEVAQNQPFQWTAGTWSGDVILNTAYNFGIAPAGSAYDLFTVALHEAGNVLAMPDIADPTSARNGQYTGARSGITPADASAIQEVYGIRSNDTFDTPDNGSLATAASLPFTDTSWYAAGYLEGELAGNADVDYYQFKPTSFRGGTTINLQTAGIGSLAARLSVFDAQRTPIASVAASSPLSGNLTLPLGALKPGSTYFIKVEGAAADAFAVGGYQLTLLPSAIAGLGFNPLNLLANYQISKDKFNNTRLDSFHSAATLTLPAQVSQRLDHSSIVSLRTGEANYFKLTSPTPTAPDAPYVMTVMVSGYSSGAPATKVKLFDAAFKEVGFTLLNADSFTHTIQTSAASRNATYYVQVQPAAGNPGKANYVVSIDFGTAATVHTTAANGTLTSAKPQGQANLTVKQSTLFHFSLTVSAATANAALRLTVFDTTNRPVFTLFAAAGETTIGNVLLAPGSYRVVFAAGTKDGSALPSLSFVLKNIGLDDNIDPYVIDTSGVPIEPAAPPPAPLEVLTEVLTDPFDWGFYTEVTMLLAPDDPYSMPFWF